MAQSKEKIFRFRQFELRNELSAMKVGTDGVLLGAWAPVTEATRSIVDVGAGTGLIALMLAQRAPQAHIRAIEVDPLAAHEARQNVAASPWPGRVEVICADATGPEAGVTAGSVDLVVSNPPFFAETLHSPDSRRAEARHGSTLTVESLIAVSAPWLAPEGRLALIAPAARDAEVLLAAALHRLHPATITHVLTSPRRPARRTLWLLSPAPVPTPEPSTLLIGSPAYTRLTSPFYLPTQP